MEETKTAIYYNHNFYYDFHKLSVLMIGRSSLETVLMNGSVYTMDILSGFLIIPTDYIDPCAF